MKTETYLVRQKPNLKKNWEFLLTEIVHSRTEAEIAFLRLELTHENLDFEIVQIKEEK